MLKNPNIVALAATAYLLIYILVIALGLSNNLALGMFMFSPVIMIGLVYSVLRHGKASGRTFDEYFYDDADIRSDKLRK
ncbi:hypothetical protein [Arundinibacter roseus]|uniref:Uncharacterized protein n=1 Tax=Arundinibacter roseus TaxID=2070510 RepID=A0A4R4K788_9BACT|nr:hypothetical protein [Arundinibacter roseus]TDB63437.1 hypothetical protein EZE20_16885 [Arundinibacter roseus]